MRSSRLRVGTVVAAAAAITIGLLVAPIAANAAIVAPTGLSPDTTATTQKNIVLSWSPVTGATSYQVQVSDRYGNFDDEDGGKASIDITTTLTSYAPSANLPHANYRWRVRASGGAWSDEARFSRGWDGAPTGLTNTGGPGGVILSWNALPDASFYEVQFNTIPFVPGTDPVDAGVGGGDEDISSCFTASTVFTPYNATKGKDEGIVEGTTVKCIEIADGATLYWRVRGRDGTNSPEKVDIERPAQECAGAWYTEKPAATIGSDDCSDWAYPSTPSFTINAHAGLIPPANPPTNPAVTPYAVAPATPISPTTVSSTPTYTWTPVANASFYRVYQTRDKKNQSIDHVWDTTSNALSPVLQEPDSGKTEIFWRVQACTVNVLDTDGFLLKYADNDTQVVLCSDPTDWEIYYKVTPQTVTNGAVDDVTGGRVFHWTTAGSAAKPNGSLAAAVSDVKGYQLQLSNTYGSFTTPAANFLVDRQGNDVGQTSARIPKSAMPSGFKWRVRGIDSSGNPYPWSSPSIKGQLASAYGQLTTRSGFALNAPINFSFNADVDGVSAATTKIVAVSTGAAFPVTIATVVDKRSFQFVPSGRWVAGESYRLTINTSVTTSQTATPAVTSGATVRATTSVDSASVALTRYVGDYGWTTAKASDARSGSYIRSDDKTSTAKRSYVQTRVRGSAIDVWACMGPSSGYARIYVDGVVKKTVNLYKSYSTCGRVATVAISTGSQHTVRFAPTGTKTKKSTKTQVRFDAFTVR